MTFNVHLLLHLGISVSNWGPLISHSAYGFEDGNRQLLKIIHAAKGIHLQVARYISLNFSSILVKRAVYPTCSLQTKHFYDQLGNTKVQKSVRLSKARFFGTSPKANNL